MQEDLLRYCNEQGIITERVGFFKEPPLHPLMNVFDFKFMDKSGRTLGLRVPQEHIDHFGIAKVLSDYFKQCDFAPYQIIWCVLYKCTDVPGWGVM